MEFTSENELEYWLQVLNEGLSNGSCDGPNFIKPYLFVTLATELKRRQNPQPIEIQGEVGSYATRMGLWDALDIKPRKSVAKRNEDGRFLPLQKITAINDIDNIAIKLTKILRPVCQDDETVNSINIVLAELLENCFYHANSEIGIHGLVCCQPWKKANLAQIAIADGGIGIRSSLSKNPSLLERLMDENSCALATEYRITGKPWGRHSGYGLALTRGLIEQNGGNLLIISEKEFFRSYNHKIKKGKIDIAWNGTLLILEFNTDKKISSKEVYNSWPLPEGFTDEDFNF